MSVCHVEITVFYRAVIPHHAASANPHNLAIFPENGFWATFEKGNSTILRAARVTRLCIVMFA